jgi:hypothetical protein
LIDLDTAFDPGRNTMQVSVVTGVAVGVLDRHKVAVGATNSRERYSPLGRCPDGGSGGCGVIDAVVRNYPAKNRVHSSGVEGGGDTIVATGGTQPTAVNGATFFVIIFGATIARCVPEGSLRLGALSGVFHCVDVAVSYEPTFEVFFVEQHAEGVAFASVSAEVDAAVKSLNELPHQASR